MAQRRSFRALAGSRLVRGGAALCLGLAATRSAADADTGAANRLARSLQNEAIHNLGPLLERYRNSPLYPQLLVQQADMLQQAANWEFRIAHDVAAERGGDPDLRRYKELLREVITASTSAAEKIPPGTETARLLFQAAQAHDELEEKEAAKRQYADVARRFPNTSWAIRGNMALADRAAENNEHPKAIPFLKQIEARPDDPHYPFALNKMAWSYFNLKDIPRALEVVEKQIRYYDDKQKSRPEGLLESERALREHALLDAAEFYFAGIENGLSGHSVSGALDYFRKLDRGEALGKMCLRFGKLLRTRKMIAGMKEWKDLVIREEPLHAEVLEMIANALDHCLEAKDYPCAVTVAGDYSRLDRRTDHQSRQYEPYQPTRKALLAHTAELQKKSTTEKKPERAKALDEALVAMYGSYADTANDDDAFLPQVHLNLAERHFQFQRYAEASAHYRWLVDHKRDIKGMTRADIEKRALASRYQQLQEKKLLATEVTPKPLAGKSPPDWREIDPSFAEWVSWIEGYQREFGTRDKTVAGMRLTADLSLYQMGYTRATVDRLMRALLADPGHPRAVPDATLILDTYFASGEWEKIGQIAAQFKKLPQLGKPAFAKKLQQAKADALYKQLEILYSKGDYRAVIARTQPYVREFERVDRVADSIFLASRSAAKLGDLRGSEHYLNVILTGFPDAPARAQALLARGALAEDDSRFDKAVRDYELYLKAAAKSPEENAAQRDTIRRRTFLLKWLAKEPFTLECDEFRAQPAVNAECEKYQALLLLKQGKADRKLALKRVEEGNPANRALWAAIALRAPGPMPLTDRAKLAEALADGWNQLDALAQFALVTELNRGIPETFAQLRRGLAAEHPLRPSTASISRRIKMLEKVEHAAGAAIKLPWAGVRVVVLAEVARAYTDLAEELKRLAPPKDISAAELAEYKKSIADITAPFEQKGKTLMAQAEEIGSALAIVPQGIGGTPAAGKDRLPSSLTPRRPVDVALLDNLEGKTWSNLVVGVQPNPQDNLRALWVDALRTKSWGRLAHFASEYQRVAKPDAVVGEMMKAISLYAVGAQPESLEVLQGIRERLSGDIRERVNDVLLSNLQQSNASKRAAELAKAIWADWAKGGGN